MIIKLFIYLLKGYFQKEWLWEYSPSKVILHTLEHLACNSGARESFAVPWEGKHDEYKWIKWSLKYSHKRWIKPIVLFLSRRLSGWARNGLSKVRSKTEAGSPTSPPYNLTTSLPNLSSYQATYPTALPRCCWSLRGIAKEALFHCVIWTMTFVLELKKRGGSKNSHLDFAAVLCQRGVTGWRSPPKSLHYPKHLQLVNETLGTSNTAKTKQNLWTRGRWATRRFSLRFFQC